MPFNYEGLDRCHIPRSLIVALLDHENLYHSINAPLTFPCSASSKPIPRRKNSFTTTLSRPKLLISTNITHPPKERKLSPNYSLDLPRPFVKKNYQLSSLDKTPSWIYHTIAVPWFYKQSQFQQAWPRFQFCCRCRINLTALCILNSSHNALLWNRQDETFIKDLTDVRGGFLFFLPSHSSAQILTLIF